MKIVLIVSLVIMILILALIGLYLLIGYMAYNFCLKRKGGLLKKISKNYTSHLEKVGANSEFYNENFRKIQIVSEEKLKLIGFYKDNNSQKLAILVHGYGGNHLEVSYAAQIFDRKGYDLLAIDMRSHGQSEGENLTMGLNESKDLLLWINKMLEIKGNYKIVLYGLSMGASTVCLTLGEKLPNNVVLAIEDCGYENAEREFSYVYSRRKIHAKWIFKIFTSFTKKTIGFNLKEVDIFRALKNSKVPVMFIHGDSDNFVPTEMVYNLSSQIPENRRKIYIAKDATHAMSYAVDPKKYEKEINYFLNQFYL